MGFGQAHGTGPDPGVHVRQILGLQCFAGMGVDRQAGTGGEHRVQAERQAGGVDHFLDLGRYALGHAHAAERRITPYADPAPFSVSLIGLWETCRGGHDAVAPVAAFFVGGPTQWRDAFAGDFAGFLKDRLDGLGIHGVGQCGKFSPELGHLENFIEDEAHIAQGRFVVSHGKPRNT